MKIKDLKNGMNGLNIVAMVVQISKPTIIRDKLHAEATLEDKTGKVLLNLWRQQVDQVKVGDKVEILNAYFISRAKVTLKPLPKSTPRTLSNFF